eukprot:COSAG05_NODE_7140_length_851_cov_1.489362_1_plen_32_part_10
MTVFHHIHPDGMRCNVSLSALSDPSPSKSVLR